MFNPTRHLFSRRKTSRSETLRSITATDYGYIVLVGLSLIFLCPLAPAFNLTSGPWDDAPQLDNPSHRNNPREATDTIPVASGDDIGR